MSTVCPWCSAPRAAGDTCPRCGANYAKAELIKTQGSAPAPVIAPAPEAPVIARFEEAVVDDPALEYKMTLVALPVALALGVLFHFLMPGLQRLFFGMPVHELGHAVSAWLCGFFAIPTLWKTLVFSDSRSFLLPLALAGGLVWLAVLAWRAERAGYVVLIAAVLVLQAIGTLGVSLDTAEMLFTFGGDGMGMVLAALLMASFFVGKRTQLYKGSLRWGFLVIGAAAFADMFATWWAAQWNADAIPFGENEGSGLSDPMKLLEDYHWQAKTIVRRYVLVGCGSLAGLALVYIWGVVRARRKLRA